MHIQKTTPTGKRSKPICQGEARFISASMNIHEDQQGYAVSVDLVVGDYYVTLTRDELLTMAAHLLQTEAHVRNLSWFARPEWHYEFQKLNCIEA